MSGGWDQALDAMTDLRHSFRTEAGLSYLTGFVSTLGKNGKRFDAETGGYSTTGRNDAQMLIRGAMGSVVESDPIWVGADVLELVEHAAETWQPELIYLDDLFIPAGFALFERPLAILDVNGKTLTYRAVSWMLAEHRTEDGARVTADGAMMLALWSHQQDPDDFIAKGELGRIGGSDLVLAHVDAVIFGSDSILREPTNAGLIKQVQVLWRLAKQEIVVAGHERVSRPTWKRAASWKQIKHVTVLTLRKAHARTYEGDEREVEWSHRWMVSGHWRNQPYKINGETVHRQIWIAPYVKGPDDKPLVVKQRAVEFVR